MANTTSTATNSKPIGTVTPTIIALRLDAPGISVAPAVGGMTVTLGVGGMSVTPGVGETIIHL